MQSNNLSFARTILLFVPAILSGCIAGYLVHLNHAPYGAGMPIDDAYIFLRYAENLASGHGFSFNPGEVSFGCTSFLWPLVVAAGIKITGMPAAVWLMQMLGVFFLSSAVLGVSFAAARESENDLVGLAAGLIAAVSPIGYMNAVSGMETALWMALPAVIFALLTFKEFCPILLGLLAGLCFLTRPEGLFFFGAVPAAVLITRLRSRELDRSVIIKLLLFLTTALVIVLPYVLYVYHHTGSLLPTTYMGKIMAGDPDMQKADLGFNILWGILSLLHGLDLITRPWGLLKYALALGCLWQAGSLIRALIKNDREKQGRPALWVMLMFIFIPAAYGYGFRVGPAFGGYYQRYIAPVALALSVLGCTGLYGISHFVIEKISGLKARGNLVLALGLLIVYLLFWAPGQLEFARGVYGYEIALNQSLRMSAADWIKDNTPGDARVLAGYTGLGVVGGNCDRYVLDLGALINPDIFEYYEGTKPMTEERWERILDYIRDKRIDYYVTFPGIGPDPAESPGFEEVAKISSQFVTSESFSEIRIYKIARQVQAK